MQNQSKNQPTAADMKHGLPLKILRPFKLKFFLIIDSLLFYFITFLQQNLYFFAIYTYNIYILSFTKKKNLMQNQSGFFLMRNTSKITDYRIY